MVRAAESAPFQFGRTDALKSHDCRFRMMRAV
jgi:hypothetical protein